MHSRGEEEIGLWHQFLPMLLHSSLLPRMVIYFCWMFLGYSSLSSSSSPPLPLYCICLPTATASCCGAPSGCVWDGVVGWHLAASDKRAREPVLFLLRCVLNYFLRVLAKVFLCVWRALSTKYFKWPNRRSNENCLYFWDCLLHCDKT